MIQQLLDHLKLKPGRLDAVAVSMGPGSYTGLRIGVSTAKGLCYGLGIPMIGINTLKAMVKQVYRSDNSALQYCPMIDARRMEVYCMVVDYKFEEVMTTAPVVIDGDSFREFLEQGTVLFFGNGSLKCRDILQHPNASFLAGVNATAKSIGELAELRMKEQMFEDLSYFEPLYLKEFNKVIPLKP